MKPYICTISNKTYEIHESLVDTRTSRIFLLLDNGEKQEITDKNQKYDILAIARNDKYDEIANGKKRPKEIVYKDGRKIVGGFSCVDSTRLLDRYVYLFKIEQENRNVFCLQENNYLYYEVGESFDEDKLLTYCFLSRCLDGNKDPFSEDIINQLINRITEINNYYQKKHPPYTK